MKKKKKDEGHWEILSDKGLWLGSMRLVSSNMGGCRNDANEPL